MPARWAGDLQRQRPQADLLIYPPPSLGAGPRVSVDTTSQIDVAALAARTPDLLIPPPNETTSP